MSRRVSSVPVVVVDSFREVSLEKDGGPVNNEDGPVNAREGVLEVDGLLCHRSREFWGDIATSFSVF